MTDDEFEASLRSVVSVFAVSKALIFKQKL